MRGLAAGIACTALLLQPVPTEPDLLVDLGNVLTVQGSHQYRGVHYINATVAGEEYGCLGCQPHLFQDFLRSAHGQPVPTEQHMLTMQTYQARKDVLWSMWQQRRLILGAVGGLTDMGFVDSLIDLAHMTPRLYEQPSAVRSRAKEVSRYDIFNHVSGVELRGPQLLTLLEGVWPDIQTLAYDHNGTTTSEERVAEILKRVKQHFTFYRASCLADGCAGKQPGPTELLGTMACSLEDRTRGDCVFAEARRCSQQCGMQWAEFGRFHGIKALFEVRRGRCSEFSRVGYAMLLALGYDTRMVIDFTDHVWVEVRLPKGPDGKWYHGDPSEGIFNRPLMYEQGWGKDLTFIFGVTPHSLEDVSERYTAKYDVMQQRRGVPEQGLAKILEKANERLRMEVPRSRWGFADGGSTLEDVVLLSHFN